MRTSRLGFVGLAAGSVLLALVGTGPVLAGPGPPPSAAGSGGTPALHQGAANQLGRWTVSRAGNGAYRLTWHSPTRIPTTDAPVQVRHRGSLAIGSVSANSRTVSVVVRSASRPDPSAYDVVMGAQVLDSPPRRWPRPRAPTARRTGLPRRASWWPMIRVTPGPTRSSRRTTSSTRSSCRGSPSSPRWWATSWPRSTRPTTRRSCCSCTDATSPATPPSAGTHRSATSGQPRRHGPARRVRSRSRATSATTTCSASSPARATSPCRSRPTRSMRSTSATPTVAPRREPR